MKYVCFFGFVFVLLSQAFISANIFIICLNPIKKPQINIGIKFLRQFEFFVERYEQNMFGGLVSYSDCTEHL